MAPPAADRLHSRVAIPSVVLAILLGIGLGPASRGWVEEDDVIGFIAGFGLSMLMFPAGYECEFGHIRGRPPRRPRRAPGSAGPRGGASFRGFTLTAAVVGRPSHCDRRATPRP